MSCRPYGSKTTIGFWALIAIADAALLVAAAGPALVLLVLAGAALLAGAARLVTRPRLSPGRLIPQPRLAPARPLGARPAPARLMAQRGMRAPEAVTRRRA